MKTSIKFAWSTLVLFFFSLALYAQEKKLDVDINIGKESQWYNNPVYWVIGGAVFILLLVLLLRQKK
jgi:asparagine N-glycosylation enzyme membrane subunit Stt3